VLPFISPLKVIRLSTRLATDFLLLAMRLLFSGALLLATDFLLLTARLLFSGALLFATHFLLLAA
jgi:hypothetical protein